MYDITPVTSTKSVVCGPASLKMLLSYYDTDVELDTLISECGVTISGCSAKDMIRVGNAHGMNMLAYNEDAEDALNADRPSIVWWKYSHFVVCCGKDENGEAVVCDPTRGRYHLSVGTFKSFYSGVSLYNGEPQDLPVSDTATAEDYEAALSDLGVNV